MKKTKIEWCDSTWNPITGCLHGCEYCYARRIAERFGGWTTSGVKIVEPYPGRELNNPLLVERDNGTVVNAPYPYGFKPTFHRYRLDTPKSWTKPRTIFVCSMADLFGDWVPDEWITAVFDACLKAPQHRYLFLTKNPQRYIDLDAASKLPHSRNMWYGTTATTEKTKFFFADNLNTFISVEPMHSDFTVGDGLKHIRWVVAGAETGNHKGKALPKREWVEHLIGCCEKYRVPLFMKDSLLPIMGEGAMRRAFPWERSEESG